MEQVPPGLAHQFVRWAGKGANLEATLHWKRIRLQALVLTDTLVVLCYIRTPALSYEPYTEKVLCKCVRTERLVMTQGMSTSEYCVLTGNCEVPSLYH